MNTDEECNECAKAPIEKFTIDQTAIKYALITFVVLSALEFVAYLGFGSSIPGFIDKYGWWMFYLNISTAALGAAGWHLYSFKTRVSCMAGMMLGMTFGMQTAMMLGAVVGATNGFFTGAVVGMITGIAAGVLAGRCCGIMGIMEGMMAGVMGGTMGPMITVMMINDHILWFMPLFMIVNLAIVIGLMHMYLKEVVHKAKEVSRRPLDALTFVSLCVIISTVLVAVMIYGPKSALFGG